MTDRATRADAYNQGLAASRSQPSVTVHFEPPGCVCLFSDIHTRTGGSPLHGVNNLCAHYS